MAKITPTGKYVYFFGGGKADGNESMNNLLGGKGANLAEMAGHPKLRTAGASRVYHNNRSMHLFL